jgi:hypothetical protein
MHHCAESIFKVDFLREYESIFETALAHESVGPGVLIDEKTRCRKSRATVPLNKRRVLEIQYSISNRLNFIPMYSLSIFV